MGLFRKKTDTPDQLEVLRLEIASVRKRLDHADQQKAQLLARIENVDETSTALRGRVESADQINAVLHQRIDSLDSANAQLGQRVGSVDGEVIRVRDDVAAVNQQLQSANTLEAKVQSLTERLNSTPVLPPLRAALHHRMDASKNSFARSRRCLTPSPLKARLLTSTRQKSVHLRNDSMLFQPISPPAKSTPMTQSLKPTARPPRPRSLLKTLQLCALR